MKCLVHDILYVNMLKKHFIKDLMVIDYHCVNFINDEIIYDFFYNRCILINKENTRYTTIPQYFNYLKKFFRKIELDLLLKKIVFFPINEEIQVSVHNFIF